MEAQPLPHASAFFPRNYSPHLPPSPHDTSAQHAQHDACCAKDIHAHCIVYFYTLCAFPLQMNYLCISFSGQTAVSTVSQNIIICNLSSNPSTQKLLVRGTSTQTDHKERLCKSHFLTKPSYSTIRRFKTMFCKDCISSTAYKLLQNNMIHLVQQYKCYTGKGGLATHYS